MVCRVVGFYKFFVVFLFFSVFVSYPRASFAESNYVLPYPSEMPGSKLYFLFKLEEGVSKYWYFGDYGTFLYNRKLADKYLVEAKTLFEYKQYVLALRALSASNYYFTQMKSSLDHTPDSKFGKKEKESLMMQAAQKHREVLGRVRMDLPETYLWQEEKKPAQVLNIFKEVDSAVSLRKEVL